MKTRVIISEKPLITAPAGGRKGDPKTTIRWRKKGDSFVLEQWKLDHPEGKTRGVWAEVPCVMGFRDEDEGNDLEEGR